MDILFKLVPPPEQTPHQPQSMIYPLKLRDSYYNEQVNIFNVLRANSVNIHYREPSLESRNKCERKTSKLEENP